MTLSMAAIPISFLSTLSLRRATVIIDVEKNCFWNFYPRSPCGERPFASSVLPPVSIFLSTLSLRRATASSLVYFISRKFLSMLSLRRATFYGKISFLTVRFLSTLSLRRATTLYQIALNATYDFYPRSPCGERQSAPFRRLRRRKQFLSTLSLRRATP